VHEAAYGPDPAFAATQHHACNEVEADGRRTRPACPCRQGRKPSVPVDQVVALKAAGKGPAEIARELKISRQSVYRALG
jgi:DNA invertase Pin-like site-specific DNA recombinase